MTERNLQVAERKLRGAEGRGYRIKLKESKELKPEHASILQDIIRKCEKPDEYRLHDVIEIRRRLDELDTQVSDDESDKK